MHESEDESGVAWPLEAESPQVGEAPFRVPSPSRGDAARCSNMSEVDLLLALWEAGDLIDAILQLASDADTAGALMEACRELVEIEDELVNRGFSYETFTS